MSRKQRHQYVCLIWGKLMLMIFPSRVTMSDGKIEVKAVLTWFPRFSYKPLGRISNWHWCEDHVCKFEFCCLLTFFNVYIGFRWTLVKIVHLLYHWAICFRASMWNLLQRESWKWVPECANYGILENVWLLFCVQHMQSSNFLLTNKR